MYPIFGRFMIGSFSGTASSPNFGRSKSYQVCYIQRRLYKRKIIKEIFKRKKRRSAQNQRIFGKHGYGLYVMLFQCYRAYCYYRKHQLEQYHYDDDHHNHDYQCPEKPKYHILNLNVCLKKPLIIFILEIELKIL